MTRIPIRQIRTADKSYVSGEGRVCYPVGITEYLAKPSNSVSRKHLGIHTLTDIVFNLILAKFKIIIRTNSPLMPLRIRTVPMSGGTAASAVMNIRLSFTLAQMDEYVLFALRMSLSD